MLDEVTTFVKLAKGGAYMAGDRRVHRTEDRAVRVMVSIVPGDTLILQYTVPT